MDTRTSPECVVFEHALLRDVVALAMLALVSAGDLLSLTALEITACIYDILHDLSVAWQKILTKLQAALQTSYLPVHVAMV